ncbi:MAG: lipoyl(octanoyl) transferase LipB [Pseudomonadota bacterium]
MTRKSALKRWFITEIPMIEYTEAWDLQARLVSARKDRDIDKDIVLLLEHPPVFTLGRRGGIENLSVSEDFLEKEGISVFQVERGGNITFHGPGQLVVYPIIDLNDARLGVTDYVDHLEEVMILVAADWGIRCQRNPLNRGVWVANKKLGSIGIAIRKGISFHGAALNVNLSLRPFSWINPCGLPGIGMTSLEQELGRRLSMDQVRRGVKRHIETVFGVELVPKDLQGLFENHLAPGFPPLFKPGAGSTRK